MGLSNCILGMGNLTWYVHVPTNRLEKNFHKIQFLTFVLLVGTFGIMVK